MTQHECGPACLTIILKHFGLHVSLHRISEICGSHRNGVTAKILKQVGESFGLGCKALKVSPEQVLNFTKNLIPSILFWDNKHFVVLERVGKKYIVIIDPAEGRKKVQIDKFNSHFSGVALCFEDDRNNIQKEKPKNNQNGYFLKYIFLKPKLILLIFVFSLITQVLSLVFPFLIQHLFDEIILSDSNSLLTNLGYLIVFIIFLYFFLIIFKNNFLIKLQVFFSKNISSQFISHLLRLPLTFFEQRTSGDLSSRINNISMIREVIARSGSTIILDFITIFVYIIAMLTQSVKLALWTFFLGLIQFLLMVFWVPKVSALIKKDLLAQANTNSYLMEMLRSIIFVKAYELNQVIYKNWANLYENQLSFFETRYKLNSFIESINLTVRFTAPLLIMYLGATEVINGKMSLGSLIAFGTLALSFLIPIGSIVNNFQQFQLLKGVLERIKDVLETTPEEGKSGNKIINFTHGSIKLEKVSYSYNIHSAPILKNITLEIKKGSKIGIVGTTGSGKTTFSKVISGLYRPTTGILTFNNFDFKDIDIHQLREQIGIVLQDTLLFNDTIANNIASFGNYSKEDIEEAAKYASLHEDIMKMPMKYNTLIGENGQTLSGGQRQRLAIARAIIRKPSLVILDEATSNLDTVTEQMIDEYFSNSNITRVVIAHRLSSIQNSDQIIVIDNGEIIEKGTHQDLLEQQGKYHQLWSSQYDKLPVKKVLRNDS